MRSRYERLNPKNFKAILFYKKKIIYIFENIFIYNLKIKIKMNNIINIIFIYKCISTNTGLLQFIDERLNFTIFQLN
jgi:hypothetical protein